MFERLLRSRNDVGLLAEEYDPKARRQVGTFPQVFSHVALINTAHNLTRAYGPAQHRAESRETVGSSGFSAKPKRSSTRRIPAESSSTVTRALSATRGARSVVTFSRTSSSCRTPLCLRLRASAEGTKSCWVVR